VARRYGQRPSTLLNIQHAATALDFDMAVALRSHYLQSPPPKEEDDWDLTPTLEEKIN